MNRMIHSNRLAIVAAPRREIVKPPTAPNKSGKRRPENGQCQNLYVLQESCYLVIEY